jgi:cytochrome c-type biogenesis protein CcmH
MGVLLLFVLLLVAVIAGIFWPWLRNPDTRDKAAVTALVVALLCAAMYLHLGAPFIAPHIASQQAQNTATMERMQALQADAKKRELTTNEWAELGAGYMEAERYAEAAEALKHAVTQSGGDADLIMAYGKALMLAADGAVTEDAARAFGMAATLMPENPEPEFLLAIGAMQTGDKEAAQARFASLYEKLPPQAPLRSVIRARLDALASDEDDMSGE